MAKIGSHLLLLRVNFTGYFFESLSRHLNFCYGTRWGLIEAIRTLFGTCCVIYMMSTNVSIRTPSKPSCLGMIVGHKWRKLNECPRQENLYHCGVFALVNMTLVAQGVYASNTTPHCGHDQDNGGYDTYDCNLAASTKCTTCGSKETKGVSCGTSLPKHILYENHTNRDGNCEA